MGTMLDKVLEELLNTAAFPGVATLLRYDRALLVTGTEPDGAAAEHLREVGAGFALQVRVPAELEQGAVGARLDRIVPLLRRSLLRFGGRVDDEPTPPSGASAAARVAAKRRG